MRLNALVTHEPPWYVARCVEVDAAAQGETAQEATANLREALVESDLAAVPVSQRPVLAAIDVPARAAPRVDGPRGFDRADVVRYAEAAGWVVVVRGNHDVLRAPSGSPVVSLPRGAEQVAPGVVRMLAAPVAPAPRMEADDVLRRLDALFARHPHDDDTTRLVREQRDAG